MMTVAPVSPPLLSRYAWRLVLSVVVVSVVRHQYRSLLSLFGEQSLNRLDADARRHQQQPQPQSQRHVKGQGSVPSLVKTVTAASPEVPDPPRTADKKAVGVIAPSPKQHGGANESSSLTVTDIDCPTFLASARAGTLGVPDPNAKHDREKLKVHVKLRQPSFWISLHHRAYDVPRWHIMKTGEYYEGVLENKWRGILAKAPRGAVVLDVGANIGYFSLVSMAMGNDFQVHSFEPNPINLLRFCESMELNPDWKSDRLHLHAAGVSDRSDRLPFVLSVNPGASQFYQPNDPALNGVQHTFEPVVSLDAFATERGWLGPGENPPVIAILKIDAEGHESRVLAGAKELLARHAIHNIFVEFSARNDKEIRDLKDAVAALFGADYFLYQLGGFAGPGRPVPWPQDADQEAHILNATINEPAKQLNVWFQPVTNP